MKVIGRTIFFSYDIKPVVKWAGGKRQLIDELMKRVPSTFNRYFEPFVGGGALLFAMLPAKAIINDFNEELINMYRVIRDNVNELIEDLKQHKNEEKYYYRIRNLDRNPEIFKKLSPVKRASRFIYLNRTCYNGLYRVNKRGEFNVPFGRYKNPNWLDETNLRLMSSYLKKHVVILNDDFEVIRDMVEPEDFVYFDPPYFPVNSTSNFTSYTIYGFTQENHKRLKSLCDYLTYKKVKFMLSNSYTKFTLELYSDYRIEVIQAKRVINSVADKRGAVREIIVRNY